MKSADKPKNETERIALLNDLEILDTLEEQAYDDLTKIAATICNTPISLVSLVDDNRQWFKSHHGLDATETPREFAFCAHAIHDSEVFNIADAEKDERFSDNPLVTGAPNVKFYAGFPLTLRNNLRVGTLCVIDSKPRELSEEQIEALSSLGRQVVSQLELRLRIKEMEKLEQMKTEFIAMVSHELRTPLTAIFGSLSLLNSGLIADVSKRDLLIKSSFENSDRLINIVNDILDLTKLESGNFEIKKEKHLVSETIHKILESLESYFLKCNVIVKSEVDKSLGSAIYDEGRLIQIINNLLSNAAKFSPEESLILLKVKREDDSISIEVQDHGKGIPKEKHGEIFKKFSKLSVPGKGKLAGTGLGLNITRQFVELHGGEIWFESTEGLGTTFYVRIPAYEQETKNLLD